MKLLIETENYFIIGEWRFVPSHTDLSWGLLLHPRSLVGGLLRLLVGRKLGLLEGKESCPLPRLLEEAGRLRDRDDLRGEEDPVHLHDVPVQSGQVLVHVGGRSVRVLGEDCRHQPGGHIIVEHAGMDVPDAQLYHWYVVPIEEIFLLIVLANQQYLIF